MSKKYSLDLVVPIFNEEKELEINIRLLHQFLLKNLEDINWRIIIADNASTDKSLKIAQKLAKQLTKVNFFHLEQKGRGRAIKKAWLESKADILAYLDVDLSTDLKSLSQLISLVQKGNDIAIGSRLMKDSQVKNRTFKREILSRSYNILIKLFFATHFSDAQCGFKSVSQKISKLLLPHVEDNAWFFDSELLILAEKLGYKIVEIPVLWIDNPGSTVRVLKTVYGDLAGLLRLYLTKPWLKIKR